MSEQYGYLALQDREDPEPWGVLRYGGGIVERYLGPDGWARMPSHADVVYGGEPGAHQITRAECERLIASGTLVELDRKDPEIAAMIGKGWMSIVDTAARHADERGVYLARTPKGDLVFGRDGSRWRHNWIPLNAVAAAMKAKRWKGHGVTPGGAKRVASKGRAEGFEVPGHGRPKTKAARMSTPAPQKYQVAGTHKSVSEMSAVDKADHQDALESIPHGVKQLRQHEANLAEQKRRSAMFPSGASSEHAIAQHEEKVKAALESLKGYREMGYYAEVNKALDEHRRAEHNLQPLPAERRKRNKPTVPVNLETGKQAEHQRKPTGADRFADATRARVQKGEVYETTHRGKRTTATVTVRDPGDHDAVRKGVTLRTEGGSMIRRKESVLRRYPVRHPDAARTRGQEIAAMGQSRSGIEAEFQKEHGASTKIMHPMPDSFGKADVERVIRGERNIPGMDKVDLQYEGGRLPGWTHYTPGTYGRPGHSDFYPTQSAQDRVSAIVKGRGEAPKPLTTADEEKAARDLLAGHADKALKRYGYHTEGGPGTGYTTPAGTTMVLNRHSPFAHGRSLAVEDRGEHLGTVTARHDGTFGGQTPEGVELPPDKLEKTLNALGAAAHLREQDRLAQEKQKADRIAETKRSNEEYVRRAKEKVDEVRRAEREKAIATNQRNLDAAVARGKEIQGLATGKAPRPRVTRKDTATMQKARDTIAAAMAREPAHLTYGSDIKDIAHGQMVHIKADSQRNELLAGHVVHSGKGLVGVAVPPSEPGQKTRYFNLEAYRGGKVNAIHEEDPRTEQARNILRSGPRYHAGTGSPEHIPALTPMLDQREAKLLESMSTDRLRARLASPHVGPGKKAMIRAILAKRSG